MYDNNLQLLFNISCIFVAVSIFITILTILYFNIYNNSFSFVNYEIYLK
ncbi:hypothetical protein QGC_0375, partial [Clostridioides difficile CD196]